MHIIELDVWKAAMELAKVTYDVTAVAMLSNDDDSLALQMRNAATQVPVNVAEGASHKVSEEAIELLFEARHYIYELETLTYLAAMLNQISPDQQSQLLEQVDTSRKLLFGFIKHFKRPKEAHE